MAKRKRKRKPTKKPSPPRRKHRTIALKGLTPTEIEAYRQQEIAQRAHEAKLRDEYLRKSGQKPGRPRGKKRLYREASGKQRGAEMRAQDAERKRRARRAGKGGAYARRAPRAVGDKLDDFGREFTSEPVGAVSRSVRAGIEKTLFRVRGTAGWQGIVDWLNARPRGASAYVMVGAGYGAQAPWVSSRLSDPTAAAGWLEGTGLKYKNRIFAKHEPEDLFIEVVSYRKVKPRGEKRAKLQGVKSSGEPRGGAQRKAKAGGARSAHGGKKTHPKAAPKAPRADAGGKGRSRGKR